MFKIESSQNEIYEQLEKNLSNIRGIEKKAEDKKNVLLVKLNSIADKLDELNFEKESEAVTGLIEVFAKSDVYNYGFNKLADEEFLEGPDEYKREKSEEDDLEDEYLNILLGDGKYDETFDEFSKNFSEKEQTDDYLKTLLDTKSYDDILNELNRPKTEEDEVTLDFV